MNQGYLEGDEVQNDISFAELDLVFEIIGSTQIMIFA